jgi:hypothetical protein
MTSRDHSRVGDQKRTAETDRFCQLPDTCDRPTSEHHARARFKIEGHHLQ